MNHRWLSHHFIPEIQKVNPTLTSSITAIGRHRCRRFYVLHASIRLLSLFSHCIISVSSRTRGQSISPTKVNIRVILFYYYWILWPCFQLHKTQSLYKITWWLQEVSATSNRFKIKFKYAQNVWQDFASCPLFFSSPTTFCSLSHILSTCLGSTHTHALYPWQ